jgi:hypothetical protein
VSAVRLLKRHGADESSGQFRDARQSGGVSAHVQPAYNLPRIVGSPGLTRRPFAPALAPEGP